MCLVEIPVFKSLCSGKLGNGAGRAVQATLGAGRFTLKIKYGVAGGVWVTLGGRCQPDFGVKSEITRMATWKSGGLIVPLKRH